MKLFITFDGAEQEAGDVKLGMGQVTVWIYHMTLGINIHQSAVLGYLWVPRV